MKIQTSLSRPEGVHPNISAEVVGIKASYEGDPWEFVQVVMQELLEARKALDDSLLWLDDYCGGCGCPVASLEVIETVKSAIAKADARLGQSLSRGAEGGQ